MTEKNYKLLWFLWLMIIMLIFLSFMPKSIGGAYQVNILPYIHTIDLDEMSLGLNPKSIIAYIVIIKIIYVICNRDIFEIIVMAGFLTFLAIITTFYMVLSVMSENSNTKRYLMFFYPIILLGFFPSLTRGYVLSFTIPLCFTILFFLMNTKKNYISLFVVMLLSWISLGLFWHTFHIMTYIMVMTYMFVSTCYTYILFRTERSCLNWKLPILVTIIFIVTWINLRASTISFTINNPNLNFELSSILSKGSFVEDYAFIHAYPVELVDTIRYLGYFFVYAIMIAISIKLFIDIFNRCTCSQLSIISTSFLISDIIFQSLYFLASKTLAPFILILFSYSLVIIYLFGRKKKRLCGILKMRWFTIVILILLFLSLSIPALCNLYSHHKESPESNIDINMFKNSFVWIEDNVIQDVVISDTHTVGHYRLLRESKTNIANFLPINRAIYREIREGIYDGGHNTILALNLELYKNHLIFGSLEAWDKYEPLPIECITGNKNLNIIFNDGSIVLASK